MSDHHFEEEQVEALKAWWKEYGTAIVVGVVLGASILGGNKYWQYYTKERSESASSLYDQMQQQLKAGKAAAAAQTGKQLIAGYSATPYSALAALLLAKKAYDQGNTDKALQHLRWTMENASEAGLQHTARLRLAAQLKADNKYQPALDLLVQVTDTAGFESAYAELTGDLKVKLGDREAARKSYRQALATLQPNSGYRFVIEQKLADLGA
ncbi:MAG: tetratricopeptide repeat protein [Gammaproteobacteria bacterium]|nr:MAG: tetratricopeptide repeat protein [Gammaproteobacteria bacterium]